jgi:hypothetical protein
MSQESFSITYGVSFSNGTFSMPYNLLGSYSDLMLNFTNALGKNVTVSVQCSGNITSYAGVGNSQVNSQAQMKTLVGCNQTFTITPTASYSTLILVAPQAMSVNLVLQTVSSAPDLASCLAMNYYWTSAFLCSP